MPNQPYSPPCTRKPADDSGRMIAARPYLRTSFPLLPDARNHPHESVSAARAENPGAKRQEGYRRVQGHGRKIPDW